MKTRITAHFKASDLLHNPRRVLERITVRDVQNGKPTEELVSELWIEDCDLDLFRRIVEGAITDDIGDVEALKEKCTDAAVVTFEYELENEED